MYKQAGFGKKIKLNKTRILLTIPAALQFISLERKSVLTREKFRKIKLQKCKI